MYDQTHIGVTSLQRIRNPRLQKYTVHQCPLELYTLVDLTCQATKSTPSNKRGCPLPTPGWRQGPSNPGQRICCSPAVRMTWRSPPRGSESRSNCLPGLESWLLETGAAFFLIESPFVIALPHNSRTRASRLEVGFPFHFLSVVTQVEPQGAPGCIASVFPLLSKETLAPNS